MGPARAHSTRPGRQVRGYPSDLTDAQWQVIAAHLPAYVPGGRGRPRIWPARRIIEAILYLDRTGCPWRYLPADFPPWQTVYGYFATWRDDGTLARLHARLRTQVRAAAGRRPSPPPRSSIPSPCAPRTRCPGHRGGGMRPRKSTAASATSPWTPWAWSWTWSSPPHPCRTARAPGHCCGTPAAPARACAWSGLMPATPARPAAGRATTLKMTLCIVARRDRHAFEVLPRRWVVERTFAWISKHRRTVRDYEHLPASHEAVDLVGHDRPDDPPPGPAHRIIRRSLRVFPA